MGKNSFWPGEGGSQLGKTFSDLLASERTRHELNTDASACFVGICMIDLLQFHHFRRIIQETIPDTKNT
jgi:hypothetical protein